MYLLRFLCLLVAMISLPGYAEQKTINFVFQDVNNKQFKLSDFKGKWVIVNFLAPWCPMCWIESPTLNSLATRKDVVVIGIVMDYGPDNTAVDNTIKSHNLQFTKYVYGGSRKDATSAYRQIGPVDFFPTSYIFNPKGTVVLFVPGQFRKDYFLSFINKKENAER